MKNLLIFFPTINLTFAIYDRFLNETIFFVRHLFLLISLLNICTYFIFKEKRKLVNIYKWKFF